MIFRKPHHKERLERLARRIEELHRKDQRVQQFRKQIVEARREAVGCLWSICRNFAESLNSLMEHDRLELTPPEPPGEIPEDEPIQLMLNVRGRVLLLDLRPSSGLISRENFKKPYILDGEVRFFNQELLENERVEEHGLFFCPSEGEGGAWLYWNGRAYRSGLVNEEYLAALLEQIL